MQAEPFDLAAVEAGIPGTQFAGIVEHLACVSSTNRLALEAARGGLRCGVWVADEQTAGRGRGGHGWHSVAGEGLYVSALVAPPLPLRTALRLSLAAGLAARAAIAEVPGLAVDLRWPNDLMLGQRKCGGILVETAVAAESALRYAVIGVGVNLNHQSFPVELSRIATSLRMEMGGPVAREPLLAALLRSLDAELKQLEQEAAPDLLMRFAAASSWVAGRRVHVGEEAGYTGVTRGLDADGFLLVQAEDGVLRTVLSGGVRDV